MTTADFTADELATLARFDATPAAPESWGAGLREELRDELIEALVYRQGWTAVDYADAALTVLAAHLGQQQAAIERVKALHQSEPLWLDGRPWCLTCRESHPCATIRALRADL